MEENIHESCDLEISELKEQIESLKEQLDDAYNIISEVKALVR